MDDYEIDVIDLDKNHEAQKYVAQQTLDQVQEICDKEFENLTLVSAYRCFDSDVAEQTGDGALFIRGETSEDYEEVHLMMELARMSGDIKVSATKFVTHVSALGDKVQLFSQDSKKDGMQGLWVKMRIKASPISMIRATSISEEIRRINGLAIIFQQDIPTLRSNHDLKKLYSEFDGVLIPTEPLKRAEYANLEILEAWAEEAIQSLQSCLNIALVAKDNVSRDFALALLSETLAAEGKHLGKVKAPALNPKIIIDIAAKAPGFISAPALSLSLNSNPYNLNNELEGMLQNLQDAATPVVFWGTYNQLQGVFHGGQGSTKDSLKPVILHLPEIGLDSLITFRVKELGNKLGGMTKNEEQEIFDHIHSTLTKLKPDQQSHYLEMLSNWTINSWSGQQSVSADKSEKVIQKLMAYSETFSGLSNKPRGGRSPEVQSRLTTVLGDDKLQNFLLNHLLGQDAAITSLCDRLRMEALTRPSQQPLRYCAQGTPGTGKSESAKLLAELLDVPFVNIDAASMPDYHTAASQLLGSGRGIVMSFQAGRLEEAAKHHRGAVLEISDLDHANPSVRSFLADLFLQVLETGEAQSATGAMFSCSNLIFAFTMNLPDGADEKVHSSMGFNNVLTDQEVTRRVISEIKDMLSGAFISRVGTPIIFDLLGDEALACILENTINKAISTALNRYGVISPEVVLQNEVGSRLFATFERNVTSFGARAILEHGRSVAANAVYKFLENKKEKDISKLLVSVDDCSNLVVSIN